MIFKFEHMGEIREHSYKAEKVTLEKIKQYLLRNPRAKLVLPSFLHCGGMVYMSVRNGEFWFRSGNAKDMEPCVRNRARDDMSLSVPNNRIKFTNNETTEETKMDAITVLMQDELYCVEVEFNGTPGRRYSYKSLVAYEKGDKLVVDTPSSGLTVVTVVECSKGVPTAGLKFENYKWTVSKVDMSEYNRLRDLEAELVKRAKAKKQLAAAREALLELGMDSDELIKLVRGDLS